jgi:hypothetical protein
MDAFKFLLFVSIVFACERLRDRLYCTDDDLENFEDVSIDGVTEIE